MKPISGIRLLPLLLTVGAAAALLTACSVELLDEIKVDIASLAPKRPEIKVSVGGFEQPDGTGVYDYPNKVRSDGDGGDTATATFTVSNLGKGELTFSVSLSGSGASNFDIDTTNMVSTLDPAGGLTDGTIFDVNFDPITSGSISATVTVTSNDEDEAIYTIGLSGIAEWWGFRDLAIVGDVTALWSFGSILVVPESEFVDGDEIFVTYTDLMDGEVKFIRSTDGGTSWSDPVTAAAAQGGLAGWSARYSTLALDGDTVYLAYQQYADGGADAELWMISSANRGVTWGIPGDIYKAGDPADDALWMNGFYPSIGVDPTSKNVYIAHYCDYSTGRDLRFAWMDPLETWTTSIIDGISPDTGMWCNLVNAGTTLYVSYYDYENGSLKFARSLDGGVSWPLITDADAFGDRGPHSSMTVDGSNVYISYLDWTSVGTIDLCFIKSTDGGETWDSGTNGSIVDTAGDVGYYTSIDVDGSDVYISYHEWGIAHNLKFVKSSDGGASWPDGLIDPLVSVGQVGRYTHLEAAGDNVYILYYDETNGTLELAKSIDRGESW